MRNFIYKTSLVLLISFLLTSLCSAQDKEVIKWLENNAIPVENTTGIITINYPIKEMPEKFKDAQIYGFGESSHQHVEFSNLKGSFFKYLVLNNDVKVFFIEESFGAAFELNQYLKNGDGDVKELIKNFRQGILKTQEVLNLISWMREYNINKKAVNQIQIYGMDSMFNYNLVNIIEQLFKENNLKLTSQEKFLLSQYSKENFQPYKIKNLRDEISLLNELSKKIEISQEFLDKTSALASVHALQNYLLFMDNPKQSVRDENMALVITKIMALGEKSKGFVWAHNLHIQKGTLPDVKLTGVTFFPKEVPSLGNLLKQSFGEKYYAVGFDFGTGNLTSIDSNGKWQSGKLNIPPAETFSEQLNKVPFDAFYFDFETAENNKYTKEFIHSKRKYLNVGGRGILPKYVNKALSEVSLSEMYDGLIYVKEVSLSSVIN